MDKQPWFIFFLSVKLSGVWGANSWLELLLQSTLLVCLFLSTLQLLWRKRTHGSVCIKKREKLIALTKMKKKKEDRTGFGQHVRTLASRQSNALFLLASRWCPPPCPPSIQNLKRERMENKKNDAQSQIRTESCTYSTWGFFVFFLFVHFINKLFLVHPLPSLQHCRSVALTNLLVSSPQPFYWV